MNEILDIKLVQLYSMSICHLQKKKKKKKKIQKI